MSEREQDFFELDDYDGEFEDSYDEDEDAGDSYYEEEDLGDSYDEEEEFEDSYYEDEIYDDSAYEDVDSDDSYYESEENGEEAYYGEEYDASDDGYEEEELEFEEIEDYDPDEEGEYDEEEETPFARGGKKFSAAEALYAFRRLPVIDKVIACTGVAVLIFAIITGTVYASFRSANEAVKAFADVGASLDGINIIGESGLLAVADAQAAKEAALETEPVTEEKTVVEEEEKGANVSLKTTSIVKDLKIKFVNSKTDKLVPNVPFEVEVKTPAGKTETWKDDDKDGVIYKEEIAPGKYELKMLALADEKYADYKIDTAVQKVTVKATIEYEKVDVVDEIKTEAEVNAAVEDTAVEKVPEESKLTDTVAFVPTKVEKAGEPVPEEISKDKIKAPESAVAAIDVSGFYLMTATVSENEGGGGTTTVDPKPEKPSITVGTTMTIEVGKTEKLGASVTPEGIQLTYNSSNASVAEVSSDGKVTGKGEGTATITVTANNNGETASATCVVTVQKPAEAVTLTMNPAKLNVAQGAAADLKVEAKGVSDVSKLKWTSDKPEIATVEGSGNSVKVKGVKAGDAVITVSIDGVSANCNVHVDETKNSVKLSADSVNVTVGATKDVTVTTVPENATITNVLSSDTAKVTVSYKDKKVTVKGVAAGDANVTITCSNNLNATLKVKVVDGKLVTKDGAQQVYVLENGKYREAHYTDYYTAKNFYIMVQGNLYQGWTSLNGKMYYYTADHKFVTGEQVILGAKYTFASDGSLVTGGGTFGIDVSKWNGKIDWNAVKASGVSYVIIRCGYRGSSTGVLVTDPRFAENIAGANAAGLKVGVYFFSQAVNEKEAVEEASMALSLVKKYRISYPIFLDVEGSGGRGDGIDTATRTAVCKAFCATVQNSGYTAGVYANKNWLNNKINAGSLGSYKIWLAQYAKTPTYSGRYNLWQYSSKGSIPGISGNVDLNQSYLGY